MRSATELKRIFQEGWNIPARVENYCRQATEFTDGETHWAWREALERALATNERQRVLDAGTGPGLFACLYSQMGHDCVGLDFSERMLAVARQRAEELHVDTRFEFGDVENPPFDDAVFDAVSSRHVLFNLPRPGVAVREWVRVLKPGGRLILIGNELQDRPFVSLADFGRRLMQFCRRPTAGRQSHRWTPAPGYREAVAECPLFRHGSGSLRAVMEAVGLCDIHLIPTERIHKARRELQRRELFLESAPLFILVGTKHKVIGP